MIDLVITGGLGFVISIILARYLGPEILGSIHSILRCITNLRSIECWYNDHIN